MSRVKEDQPLDMIAIMILRDLINVSTKHRKCTGNFLRMRKTVLNSGASVENSAHPYGFPGALSMLSNQHTYISKQFQHRYIQTNNSTHIT